MIAQAGVPDTGAAGTPVVEAAAGARGWAASTSAAVDAAIRAPARLARLRATTLLERPESVALDRIARLAARVLRVPVALVSLVDADRQLFLGCVGLPEPWQSARGTPLSHSFCQYVVARNGAAPPGEAAPDTPARAPRTARPEPLLVEDARRDPVLRTNGAVRDLDVVAYAGYPLVTDDGHVLGSVCAIDHIPRAWTAEDVALLADLAGAAVTEIEYRTALRAHVELADAAQRAREEADARRRDAEVAAQAKATFLATMSHELRTPINAVLGYTQLLDLGLGGPLTDQQRAYLSRLRDSGRHLLALVNDVLDLAKADAGQMNVAGEPAVASHAVEAALALTVPQAAAKRIRLVEASAPETGRAPLAYVGDEARVRQILVNLVDNAVKFTPAGGMVSVSAQPAPELPPGARVGGDGPWVALRVADTGPGIAPAHQARIFEPFVQAEQGHTRSVDGTGLGLAISRRLARLMGGDLTLESAPGAGASFTLWLPASEPDGVRAADRSAPGRVHGTASARAHGLSAVAGPLRERIGALLEAVSERLRHDPAVPGAASLPRAELEGHQPALVTDLIQTLVILDESGGHPSPLAEDAGDLQRTVAALHGRARHAQGWTEAAIAEEYAVLAEELAALARRVVPDDAADVTAALNVLDRLIEQASEVARRAWRHAAGAEGVPAAA